MRPRRPWRLRIAKLSPLSRAPGRPSGVVSYAYHYDSSPSPGGLRSAQLSPRSWAPVRPSGGAPYADHHDSSPLSGGGCDLRNCRHFRGLLRGPAEVRLTQITTVARRPLGGCDLRNCRHFRGHLRGPAEVRLTQHTAIARRHLGAAICVTVATFAGSWEVQQRGVLRGSQL